MRMTMTNLITNEKLLVIAKDAVAELPLMASEVLDYLGYDSKAQRLLRDMVLFPSGRGDYPVKTLTYRDERGTLQFYVLHLQ
jgi:hypothetical protein